MDFDFPDSSELVEFIRLRPWAVLAAFATPYLILAWWRRIYPSAVQTALLCIPVVLTAAVLISPRVFPAMLALDALLGLVAAIDLFTLPRGGWFEVERETQRVASIQQNHRVQLTITNRDRRVRRAWVRDDVPSGFDYEPKEFQIRLEPRSRAVVHYDMKAHSRGAFDLKYVYLRVRSWLSLWQQFTAREVASQVQVYPDMKQLAEYAALARTNRLSLVGVRRTRKIGQDNEFERLRDYTRDDNYRHIDWRTTARRKKLTVKDFQTNQSQRIIFMMDCGRMMTSSTANGMSLLDHSLNAMLMMSYVALRQGDSVGLISFSDQIHRFVPARGSMSQMNHLLHATYDQFPQMVESRYDQAFMHLRTQCPKRALVVLFTNLIDEVNSLQVQQYLSTLVGRHLPLTVLMRDHRLFDAADNTSTSGPAFYEAAAAAGILTWRHQVLTDLEHKGVLMIDTFPEDMTAPLVNRYLEIKARHLL